MSNVSVQVKLDLDNDGWINEGVPEGAPPNIFPRSPYTTGSGLRGRQYTTLDDVYEDVQDISPQGLMKRQVKMGKDVDGDYSQDIRLSFGEYYSAFQRHLVDHANLVPVLGTGALDNVYVHTAGAANTAYWGRWQYGAKATFTISHYDTWYNMLIGLDYNLAGNHGLYYDNSFHDVAEEYTRANGTLKGIRSSAIPPLFEAVYPPLNPAPIGQVTLSGTPTNSIARQSFTLWNTYGDVTEVSFKLGANVGTPTGTMTVRIHSSTGSDISTTLYTTTLTPTPNAVNTHVLTTPLTLSGTGEYWVSLMSTSVQTLGNYWQVLGTTVSAYTGGVSRYGTTGSPKTDITEMAMNVVQHLTVSAATPTWQGIPVTAGKTYTLSVYVNASVGNMVNAFKMRVYGDSATLTAPNYGRLYLAGTNVSTAVFDTVRLMSVNFTVPVGVTQIAIDIMTLGHQMNFTVGAIMLSEGVVTHPTDRSYDSGIAYGESQFTVTAEADKDYTLSFWARSLDGIDSLDGFVSTAKIGDSITEVEDTHSLAITTEWQRFDFYLANRSYLRGVGFEWTTEKGGLPTGLDNVGTLEIRGFMLVEGSEPTTYQVGPIAAYDDVTEYVLSWNTSSGKDDFNDPMAYEGQATILLNNVSRLFSPKNQDSPLYGYLIQNLKVVITLGGVSVWQGWVTEYEISAGLWEDRQVTLSCKQGIYRLKEGEFSATVRTDAKINDVLTEIIDNSGWKPTTNPFYSVLGGASLDESFTLNDPEAAFSRIDEGVNTLEITGLDWGRKTDVDSAISDLLESESAMLWIDRDGKLVMVNREYWVNREPDVTYNIDSLPYLTRAEYQYGQDMVNRVQVTINKKRQTTDTPVWKTYRAVYVKPQSNRYLEINPQYQEGRARTVVNFTLDGATKTGYYKDPGMKYEDTDNANTTDMERVILELIPDTGNRYRLRINNTGTKGLWIDVELKGDYLETGDETPIIYEDTEAIELTGAIHYEQVTTDLLSRDYEAENMAAFRVLRAAVPDGEFKTLEFQLNMFMLEELETLLDTVLGHIVEITEGQTGEVSSPHVVIAEEFSLNGGVITVRFMLARAQKERYFALDTDELRNPTINLIEDMANVIPMGISGTVTKTEWGYEDIDTILVWNLKGHAFGELLLNPAPNQYRHFNSTLQSSYWPELTAASASTAAQVQVEGRLNNPLNSSGVSDFIDPEDNMAFTTGVAEFYTHMVAASFGVEWRMTYGAQQLGISKQGDTTFKMLARIPVLPNVKYRAMLNYANYNAYTFAYKVHHSFGALSGLASHTGTSSEVDAKLDFTTTDNAVAFSLIGGSGAVTSQMAHPSILQLSNVNNPNLVLDTAVSHKYTLYCKIDPKQFEHDFTLEIYGVDGSIIGTQTQTVGYTLTKFEVTIPSGANSKTITAILRAELETYNEIHNVYIYAHGVTQASVSSVTELLTPQEQFTLYL